VDELPPDPDLDDLPRELAEREGTPHFFPHGLRKR